MKNIFRYFVASLLVVVTFSANSQQNFPINLETVLKLAGSSNLTVQEYQLKYQQALADQSKAKEWWLPTIYAGISTHYLNGSAMNTDGKIFTGVNRNNLWAGLGIAAEIDFSKGFYASVAAKQKSESVNYFSIAEKNKAVLDAVQTYFDLQAEQLKYIFLQQLVLQSDTLTQQIKIQVDAGLRYQSEYLLAQSNFSHLKISMLQAKIEWQKKSALLVSLLNLENNINLVSADTLLVPLVFTIQPTDSIGFQKRSEFLGLRSELQSYQTLRKTSNQGLFFPKLKVGFDNGGFGAYTVPLSNTYQLNASLLWNLPLGRLSYNGDLTQWDTKILLQQNKVEQFKNQYQQEILIATSQMQITEEQMIIAKQAMQSSVEALNQSIERQKLGTSKSFEVFQAQQFFLQSQMDWLNAIVEYNKVQYALKIIQGENL